MAFSKNKINLVSFNDPLLYFNKKQKQYLDDSWAGFFQKEIFPNINEGNFSTLYSDFRVGRFNNPVNEIVGSLMIKDLFHYTDRAFAAESTLDIRFKYALNCTSKPTYAVSSGALVRFRKRVSEYKKKTGVDLLANEYKSLSPALKIIITKYGFKPSKNSKLLKSIS